MSIEKPEDTMSPKDNNEPIANTNEQRQCLAHLEQHNPLYTTFLAKIQIIRGTYAADTRPADQDPGV